MELVAGSYEQVLFGFTVRREPATSGDREVRSGDPGAAGGRAGKGGLVPSLADTAASSGSSWIIGGGLGVGNRQTYAGNPSSRETEAGGG